MSPLAIAVTNLYVENPDKFWEFMWIIVPPFSLALLWGMRVHLKEAEGMKKGVWLNTPMLKPWAIGVVLSIFWANCIWEVFGAQTLESLLVTVVFVALLLSIPLVCGAAIGMILASTYTLVRSRFFEQT